MKIENIEQAIELINEAVPYSDQIRYNSIREDAIYFKWRGDSFKLTLCTGSVEEVGDGVLIGSNCVFEFFLVHGVTVDCMERCFIIGL